LQFVEKDEKGGMRGHPPFLVVAKWLSDLLVWERCNFRIAKDGLMVQDGDTPAGTAQLAHRAQGIGLALAVSLLMHAGATTYVILQKGGNGARPAVNYIDLKMLQPAAEVAKPAAPRPVAHSAAQVPPADPPARPSPPTAYDRLQNEVQKALQTADSRPEAVNDVSIGLGMTNGYFSSLSEGKTLRPEIREYYFNLLHRVNETWWVTKNGRPGWARDAIINVVIARNGAVVGLELARGSGNPAWDRAMLKSLEAASPLPPLPDSYTDEFFRAPLRFVAPLGLMAPGLSPTSGESAHSDSSGSSSTRSRS
jgi:protein TonB